MYAKALVDVLHEAVVPCILDAHSNYYSVQRTHHHGLCFCLGCELCNECVQRLICLCIRGMKALEEMLRSGVVYNFSLFVDLSIFLSTVVVQLLLLPLGEITI